jgi:Brp/Blh family beta-carotene 15,15'-monooxygenase
MAHALPDPLRSGDGATARILLGSRAVFVGLTAAFAVGAVAGVSLSVRVQSLAYLGLMGTVSLFHGGFEHVANLKGRGERFQARYLVAYVVLVAASIGLFLVAPAVGLVVALAVTVFKGGYGGLSVLRRTTGEELVHLRAWRGRAVGALVRGGAVMVVPYLFFPGIFSTVAAEMVALFDPNAFGRVAPLFGTEARALVGGWYAGLVAAYRLYGSLATGGRAWRAEAAETALLIAYFAVVPPILAVGVYFPCWYAARQVGRMTAAGEDPTLSAVARRVLRGGVAPWLGALAILAGLALWLAPATPLSWVALYSVFVAAIAVPHVVVGGWLDRTQGIWAAA